MATPTSLFKLVSAGKFKPVYYFYGPEEYRLAEARKYLVKQFLPDLQVSTNYRKIDGKRTSVADLSAELSTLPMLGERQVFSISEIQSFKPKELQRIFQLLKPPDPSRLIIFSSPSSKVPKKSSAFFKAIAAVAEPVEFKKMTEQETAGQIRSRLAKENLSIEPEALSLLIGSVAGNRGALEQELGKLVSYKEAEESEDNGKITSDDIRRVCSGYEIFNMFHLADRIVDGNPADVIKMLSGLISEGTHPTVLATLLQQHFTSLYLVKAGKSPLGNRGFLIQNFRRQAQHYSSDNLERIIISIAKLDSELRRSKIKPQVQLEILALELVRSRAS
ncbi:MAG: DNA polymerase III subunit delta [bacterium]|nr:DNA polymerase III subunit delta [bacterium]